MVSTHTDTDTMQLDEMLAIAQDGARAGQTRPLLGGEVGLVWTLGATIALTVHGLALMGRIPLESSQIGLIWLTYGVVGGLIGFVIGRRISEKPGADSILNRVSDAAWTVTGVMFFAVALSTVFAQLIFGAPYIVYNFIVPLAFTVSAVNNGILARLTGFGYLKYGSVSGRGVRRDLCPDGAHGGDVSGRGGGLAGLRGFDLVHRSPARGQSWKPDGGTACRIVRQTRMRSIWIP